MKKIIIALGLVVVSVVMAQAQDSENRSLGDFTNLKVSESIRVTLVKGDKNEALVEVDGVDLDRVLTEIDGSTLNIHLARGNYRSTRVNISLTYINLESVKVSSSASVTGSDAISTEKFEVQASSSGKVKLVLNVRELESHASSSGKIDLTGKAKYQDIHASSSGRISAFELDSEEAKVHVSSSGKAEITAHKLIDAHASSSGKVYYKGNPDKIFVESSSSGKIIKD